MIIYSSECINKSLIDQLRKKQAHTFKVNDLSNALRVYNTQLLLIRRKARHMDTHTHTQNERGGEKGRKKEDCD